MSGEGALMGACGWAGWGAWLYGQQVAPVLGWQSWPPGLCNLICIRPTSSQTFPASSLAAGNFKTLQQASFEYGSDAMRIALADAGG